MQTIPELFAVPTLADDLAELRRLKDQAITEVRDRQEIVDAAEDLRKAAFWPRAKKRTQANLDRVTLDLEASERLATQAEMCFNNLFRTVGETPK